jgi:hypothetical protein
MSEAEVVLVKRGMLSYLFSDEGSYIELLHLKVLLAWPLQVAKARPCRSSRRTTCRLAEGFSMTAFRQCGQLGHYNFRRPKARFCARRRF